MQLTWACRFGHVLHVNNSSYRDERGNPLRERDFRPLFRAVNYKVFRALPPELCLGPAGGGGRAYGTPQTPSWDKQLLHATITGGSFLVLHNVRGGLLDIQLVCRGGSIVNCFHLHRFCRPTPPPPRTL